VDVSAPLAALPGARTLDASRYAIGGRAPSVALKPPTFAEVAESVRECALRGLALVPWGGGVSLSHETAPPPRYDVALDLGALRDVPIYEPDDYTLTAGCGIPMSELRARLEERGQELPLECAAESAATLGGVLACNASGARRLAFGAPRDRILGARFVTGDGTLARAGGRTVKNVAGHAVHRLLVGSHGGLGVLLEASLKLLPQPPARLALVHGLQPEALADAPRWHGFARREPAALSVVGHALAGAHPALASGSPFTLVTGFEGDPAWIESCRAFALERLGAPVAELRGADVPPLWRALADAHERAGPRLAFASAHNTPAALASLAAGHGERSLFHAPAGRLHVWPEESEADALVRERAAAGFTLIESRALGLDAPLPPAAVLGLRARIATALDPAGIMAYGPRWRAGM
jgi:glycolate oxidase FAD binding subunit